MIAVTHDLRLREYADNVYELADGKLTLSKILQTNNINNVKEL